LSGRKRCFDTRLDYGFMAKERYVLLFDTELLRAQEEESRKDVRLDRILW